MTRINCIPVAELTPKHLVAEYRELPRVYALSAKAYERGYLLKTHGQHYTLGTGHVKFFYSRLGYIMKRHSQLIQEMLARGYKPSYRDVPVFDLPDYWLRDWEPDERALEINRARIMERM